MNYNKLEDVKPLCYESGEWDGLKSDLLLVYDYQGNYNVAVAYGGIMDGSKFIDFFDMNDREILNVTQWMELPSADNY